MSPALLFRTLFTRGNVFICEGRGREGVEEKEKEREGACALAEQDSQ